MLLLQIGILVFTIIEILNIMTLYSNPSAKYGNSVGVFNAYEDAKKDPKIHNLVSYLINWVAGAKLIFIMLAIVIVFLGDKTLQQFAVGALIISILSFYFKLYPLLKKMDANDELTPKGYQTQLNVMILIFVLGFAAILVISIF